MATDQDALLVELLREVLRGVVQEELKPLQKQVSGMDKAIGRIEAKQDSAHEEAKVTQTNVTEIRNALERQGLI